MKIHSQKTTYNLILFIYGVIIAGMLFILSGCGGQETVQSSSLLPALSNSINLDESEPTIPESTPSVTISESELKVLVADMVGTSYEKRNKAASELILIGDKARVAKEIVNELIAIHAAQNEDLDSVMIYDVMSLLEDIGTPSVKPLLSLLKNEDGLIRRNAVSALGIIGDIRAVEPLLAIFEDTNMDNREFIAEALGNIGDERAVESLIAALHDNSLYVRMYSTTALGKIGGDRSAEALTNAYNDTGIGIPAEYLIDALGETKNVLAVEPLITALQEMSSDRSYRQKAVAALEKIGGIRAAEALLAVLKDNSSDVRYWAAQSLSDANNYEVKEFFNNALDAKDLEVIAGACKYFVRLGKDDSESILISAMYSYSDADMAGLFLNCGNPQLEGAAKDWFEANGYKVLNPIGGASDAIIWQEGS